MLPAQKAEIWGHHTQFGVPGTGESIGMRSREWCPPNPANLARMYTVDSRDRLCPIENCT